LERGKIILEEGLTPLLDTLLKRGARDTTFPQQIRGLGVKPPRAGGWEIKQTLKTGGLKTYTVVYNRGISKL